MTEQKDLASTPLPEMFVVGIGASAGGLEALKSLLSKLIPSDRYCVLVAQHLSPQHSSMLTQLLARDSRLPVVEARDGLRMESGHVYVTPPHADVEVRQGVLCLESEHRKGPRPSVDMLLRSLAREYQDRTIAVVLSGTGSDGAVGVVAVKAANGLVMVQDRETAKYIGMPQAALKTGCVDFVLPPEQIAIELQAILEERASGIALFPDGADEVALVLRKVRERTNVDFTGYKQGTVLRRLQARMSSVQARTLPEYLRLLEKSPGEVEELCRTILIQVTSFFRDPEHFEALREALRQPLATLTGSAFRVWVPGCASGEEVYSVAMLLDELQPGGRVQIFGTDLDEEAITFARKGVYLEQAVAHLRPEVVERYFRKTQQGLQIERRVRDMAVFSRHDLVRDPPFVNLDLISCRNVQIYLEQEWQSSTLRLFHQALKPAGILFLGKSETASHSTELFEDVNRKFRIYRNRKTERVTSRMVTGSPSPRMRGQAALAGPVLRQPAVTIEEELLKQFAPPSVLVDAKMNVQHAFGQVSRFLSIVPGRADLNLMTLLPRELRAIVRAQVRRVQRSGRMERGVTRQVKLAGGDTCNVQVSVAPAGDPKAEETRFLTSFVEMPAGSAGTARTLEDETEQAVIDELQNELLGLREHLQTAIEELETSNEELQLLNEELQSSNEELEASNEELQSTNEELITVNDELSQTSVKLSGLVADLENIQNSVDTPVLVVDQDLILTRYNEPAARWLGLSAHDAGRPLNYLESRLRGVPLKRLVAQVLRTGKAVERQLLDRHRRFLVRVNPYRGGVNGKRAFTLAVMDITELSRAKEALVRSKARQQHLADQYEMTLDCMNAHVAVLSPMGEIVSVNQQWRRFAGDNEMRDPSCGVGTNYIELCLKMTGSEAARCRDVARGIRGVLSGELPQFVFEYPCHALDAKRWFRCIVTPLKSAEGGAVMMHLDVTDRVTVEHKLLLQVAALESVPIAVFITNGAREIQWVNAAFTRMMGYGASEVVGRTPDLLRANRQDAVPWEGLWRTVEEGRVSRGEVIHQHRDGGLVTVQQTITPIKVDDQQTTCYVVIAEDITGRKEAEWRILHMAQHDSLTGLPNRTLFNERLRQSIEWADRRNRKVALILLDLDQFKDTNDTLGHQVGDALLVAVARRLETRIRALEVLARMGGDEFAIYTEDAASHEMIADAASRVLGAFQEPFVVDDQMISVTASLGIAVHPDDSVSVEGLFRAADLAMYKVKGTQRNAFRFYDPETDRETSERVRLARDLRASFTTGKLWMAMQPQVSLFNGQLVAAEALLRWNTDDWEGVTPARLISVAEESGIIHALGDWVLAEVCGMMRHWQDAGLPPMRFGVNLSAMQLAADKAADNILAALARRSIEPRCLQVEITESVLLQHSERVRNNIRQLHEAGIGLVLDDFGTGYSSLTYLRQFPVQSLKIDLSFVQGVGTNRSDEQIIAALIDLAHALGIQVCAEGVETAEQVEFLRSRGCDLAQGYYFCYPVSLDQLQDLLVAGTAWPAKLAQAAAQVRRAAASDG
jgi:two-component system CheB/CheR fusion protein